MDYADIIRFWFSDIEPACWWQKDDAFDALLRQRFGLWHQAAAQGELATWRQHAEGRLAEIILLDQFSRNMFRQSAQAFAYDLAALILAQTAIITGDDQQLSVTQRSFLYLPFMHSESLAIQQQSLQLYSQTGLAFNYDFAQRHHAIIARFGRFPHRNALLGRTSTDEELAFLQQPNSSF